MKEFCSHRILPRSFFNCFPRPLQKIFLCSGLLLICIKTFHLQNNNINTAFRSFVMSLQTILDKKCHHLCTTFFLKGCLFPEFGNAITPPSLHYHLSLQPTPKQVAKLEGWGQETGDISVFDPCPHPALVNGRHYPNGLQHCFGDQRESTCNYQCFKKLYLETRNGNIHFY